MQKAEGDFVFSFYTWKVKDELHCFRHRFVLLHVAQYWLSWKQSTACCTPIVVMERSILWHIC